MKTLIAAIAALGAMSTFVGSALADVSINIRFGSTPTYRNYDSYRNSYRSNPYRQAYPNYPNNYGYNRNVNSSVIVPEVYPSSSYGNFWNRGVVPRQNPYSTIRSTVYDPFNVYRGDRYIVEKRIIRVR